MYIQTTHYQLVNADVAEWQTHREPKGREFIRILARPAVPAQAGIHDYGKLATTQCADVAEWQTHQLEVLATARL